MWMSTSCFNCPVKGSGRQGRIWKQSPCGVMQLTRHSSSRSSFFSILCRGGGGNGGVGVNVVVVVAVVNTSLQG